MPCFQPMRAWSTDNGAILLTKTPPQGPHTSLQLPCGKCLGCQQARAKAWALRCTLELQQHKSALFTTLTYADKYRPPTLDKRHLSGFLKRLRKAMGPDRAIRFFASGEYGEKTQREHYHAILYGASRADIPTIDAKWPYGHTTNYNVDTDKMIAYVAGYVNKKLGFHPLAEERVDPDTGEVYRYQPPFIQMSRRPGIGGHARKHTASWKQYAIYNGHKMAVPRFYHEAWKQQATEEQIKQNQLEKIKHAILRDTSDQALEAQEKHLRAQISLRAERRNY